MPSAPATRTLKLIAAFEGAKGIAALAVLLGIADLLHHDARHVIAELIGHAGFRGASRTSSLLLHYADLLRAPGLHEVFVFGLAYAGLRLAEAYGLWQQRAWALWLGTLSGGLYIPFELVHVARHPHAIGLLIAATNLGLVVYLCCRLRQRGLSAYRQKPPPATKREDADAIQDH